MAFVELDGEQKPRFQPTHVSELPHDTVEELCLFLNPPLLRKDYRSLAGKMGMTHKQVKNIDRKANPTEELLEIWMTGSGSKNVTDLIDLLTKIERYDAIDHLRQHEYKIEQDRPSSLNKQPVEHDIESEFSEEDGLAGRFNPGNFYTPIHYPGSVISDPSTVSTLCPEDPDTDEETNMSIVSGGYSNRTSSSLEGYLDTRSRASTNDRKENNEQYMYQESYQYRQSPAQCPPQGHVELSQMNNLNMNDEYDDILQQKLRNQRAMESDDTRMFHPNYQFTSGQFRGREGSNASTSTAGSLNTSTSTKIDTGIQTEQPSPTVGDLPPASLPQSLPQSLQQKNPLIATDKIALLIGNMHYQNLSEPLVFPHKDVFDLKNALGELGFKVLSLVDLTLREMRTIMLAYCKLLGPGVFAVFYYAGHGFEENGKNYLMPIDATPAKKEEEFIQAQEILNEMRLAQTALNLVIVDTCRVKGIEVTNTRGRLQRHDIGNTIIAYSCSSSMPAFESHVQENGVYMSELLPRIKEDTRIEHILMDVNEAVHGNLYVVQRPVFESDAIGDCRLTCRIDGRANYEHWSQRFDQWFEAATPPDPQVIQRETENLSIKLEYESVFSNMLQINVSICNNNSSQFVIQDAQLRNGSELEIHWNRKNDVIPPNSKYTDVACFRIKDLQKVTYKLLLVLEIKAKLNGEDANIEVKMNADFPLVSSFLQEFLSWITADKRAATGTLKNTWV